MPFDPQDAKSVASLVAAIEWSTQKLQPFQEERIAGLKAFSGPRYGERSTQERQPINMIEQMINIYKRQVASFDPATMTTTEYTDRKPAAADLELMTNQQIRLMNLGKSLTDVATDAFFGPGILKVGIDEDNNIFAEPVLFEDYVVDMSAKSWDKIGFEGHWYRCDLDWVVNNPEFDEKVRQDLTATSPSGEDRNLGADIQSGLLSREQDFQEYKPTIELLEVFLPEEQLVLTMANKKVLKVTQWQGRKEGPLHHLLYETVPGNLMPLPPIYYMMDLHELGNMLFNKVASQARRQKTVLGVQGHAKDDGSRVVQAADGEAIYVENPQAMNEMKFGGADQGTLAMVVWAKDMFSYFAGNLDSIGGLGAQTQTVGQDRLLASSASQRVQDMQKIMATFTKGVVKHIAWLAWNDPTLEMMIQKPIGDTGYSIQTRWTPQSRVGNFFDYSFEVNPYSMQVQSPSDRIATVTQFVTQILLPAMPAFQQSGLAVDWEKFIKLFSKYTQCPELSELMTYANGEQHPARDPYARDQGATMPTSTTRNYVRENRPGASRSGKDKAMMAMLLGGGSQPAESAALMRPTS